MPSISELPQAFTPAEFQRRYSLSRSTFYRLVNAGELRLWKVGRASRVSRDEAERWFDGLPTVGGEA